MITIDDTITIDYISVNCLLNIQSWKQKLTRHKFTKLTRASFDPPNKLLKITHRKLIKKINKYI